MKWVGQVVFVLGKLNETNFFAEPQFSTDNASGVAIIASILDR